MKVLVSVLILVLCLPSNLALNKPNNNALATASQVENAAAIILGAEEAIKKLQSLISSLSGEAKQVVGIASQELSVRLQQFRELVKEDLQRSIEQLNLNAQNLGRQIQSAVFSINELVDTQRRCGFQNAEDLLSGMQNIVGQFKKGIFFLRPDAPRVTSFKFDGHDSSVVPQEGGRFTIRGFRLWEHNDLQPSITLWDDSRTKKLKSLSPQRANDSNSISGILNKELLQKYSGQCLSLQIQTKTKKILGKADITDLYIPMCVPKEYSTKLKVIAHVLYTCSMRSEYSELAEQQFLYYNNSCESGSSVNDIRNFDIPDNCKIITWRETFSRTRNTTSVGLHLDQPKTIKATGNLDTGDCTNLLVGKKLNASTIWEKRIVPKIECRIPVNDGPKNSLPVVTDMNFPTTSVNAYVPAGCNSESSTFWFEVFTVNGQDENRIYESPRINSPAQGAQLDSIRVGGLTISGRFNPRPINGNTQVSVLITSARCGQ